MPYLLVVHRRDALQAAFRHLKHLDPLAVLAAYQLVQQRLCVVRCLHYDAVCKVTLRRGHFKKKYMGSKSNC